VFEPGDRFGDGLGLRDAHGSDPKDTERILYRLWVIGIIQELGGSIQCISGSQNFQHRQSQGGSCHADGKTLATQLAAPAAITRRRGGRGNLDRIFISK